VYLKYQAPVSTYKPDPLGVLGGRK